jgi:hypothetical protein
VAGVGVDVHVEHADPLDERAVRLVVDVQLGLDVAFDVGSRLSMPSVPPSDMMSAPAESCRPPFDRLAFGLLHRLVADLQPAVAGDQPVEHGETEVALVVVLAPQVVEHLFGDDRLAVPTRACGR